MRLNRDGLLSGSGDSSANAHPLRFGGKTRDGFVNRDICSHDVIESDDAFSNDLGESFDEMELLARGDFQYGFDDFFVIERIFETVGFEALERIVDVNHDIGFVTGADDLFFGINAVKTVKL